jgi:hypothetical protein
MTPEERTREIGSLLAFDAVATRFAAKPNEVYRWISVHKMPTWLVDGELRFHPVELEEWIGRVDGVERLREGEPKP